MCAWSSLWVGLVGGSCSEAAVIEVQAEGVKERLVRSHLETIGILPAIIHRNLSSSELVARSLARAEGTLTATGAIAVRTGSRTGRSPADRFIVDEPSVHKTVAWGSDNQPCSRQVFDRLLDKAGAYLQHRDAFVFDGFAGAHHRYRMPVRVVAEATWHALFSHALFLRPSHDQLHEGHGPGLTVVACGALTPSPKVDGTRSDVFVGIDLEQFDCDVHQGINTDMRAVRKDYFLDHDHSCYVDQWDWELRIDVSDRNLDYLKSTVKKIWSVIYEADAYLRDSFPKLRAAKYPPVPKELVFLHAEDILEKYPNLPRKQRETGILQEYPAIFIIGIGWVLKDGYPHEMRAADYDDWCTPTSQWSGKDTHGLNGDILVWNPVTKRRHELTSMGIRVTKETLKQQLEMSGQRHFLTLPYHQAILNNEIPLSMGGGIGQSRLCMYLLRTAHLGEVSASVWPKELKEICAAKNIRVLE